jgi:hypothetical protein
MTDDTSPKRRLSRFALTVAITVVVVGLWGGAVAWAMTRNADSDEVASETVAATSDNIDTTATTHHHDVADPNGDARAAADAAAGHHHHEPLPPYDERYAAATPDQQQAADDLLADVRDTLAAAYTDVDAAVAAGYRAPRRQAGRLAHYLNPAIARSGDVLDPAKPTGLVYFTGGGGDPILLGAFFVAPAGTEAPTPAGDLVVWHSHSPDCPGFFATPDAPCLDARRMLHVWTVDEVTLPGGRRNNGEPVTVRVVDPFGVPFRASVEKVDG